MAYDKYKSKTVLIVFFYEGVGANGRTFYSNYRNDYKHDNAWIENAINMTSRLLINHWKGKYKRAILYKNGSNEVLQYWKNGVLVMDNLN